jgi:hypothetical protein
MKRILILAALTSGCSLSVMRKPQTGNVTDTSCTRSRLPAIVDTVIVAAAAVTAGVAMATIDGDSQTREAIAGPAVLGGVLFTASAGNGYRWARECRGR